MLIKLDDNYVKDDNICQISLSCEDKNHIKYNRDIVFNFERTEEDFFSDQNIEISLGLYYFTKFNRKIMKICNEECANKEKNSLEFISDKKFDGIKKDIAAFLNNHYNKYNVNENLNKYLTNMNNICKNAKSFANQKLKESEKDVIELDEDEEEKEEIKDKMEKNKKDNKTIREKKLVGKKRKSK